MMKFWWHHILKSESGQVLPIVLVTLVVGALVMIPSLNHVSTNLNTQIVLREGIRALYAADAGIEDAVWKIKYEPPPDGEADAYWLDDITLEDLDDPAVDWLHDPDLGYWLSDTNGTADINGMSVKVIIIRSEFVEGGVVIGDDQPHLDWVSVNKTLEEVSPGQYFYNLYINNEGEGNINVKKIIIYLSPYLTYCGPTTGDLTDQGPDPITGVPDTGITLIWEFQNPGETISSDTTAAHTFWLDGPPGIPTASSVVLKVGRQDIRGISDDTPYTIRAAAVDSDGTAHTVIQAEVWEVSGNVFIRSWRINPESS
jgi:Tfp pilus assembly protein PilX